MNNFFLKYFKNYINLLDEIQYTNLVKSSFLLKKVQKKKKKNNFNW